MLAIHLGATKELYYIVLFWFMGLKTVDSNFFFVFKLFQTAMGRGTNDVIKRITKLQQPFVR